MAGGTFTAPNKVRPGAYINYTSTPAAVGMLNERGIATIPLSLSFGDSQNMIAVTAETDIFKTFGYGINDPELLLLRECMKRAKTVLAYRVNSGEAAARADGNLTVTAKHGGVRGNNITVKIIADVNNPGSFIVETYLDGSLVDSQTGAVVADLTDNDYVLFSGTGALAEHAGIVLTGGEDADATTEDYSNYFAAAALLEFHAMALPVSDTTIRDTAIAFIRRLREDEGKRVQLVAADATSADYEGVISVKNGVILSDGTTVDKVKATAYVAGMTAGAAVNKSNTYDVYVGAADVDTRYLNSEIIAALEAGEFLFVERGGKVYIEQDINTFTSFTPEKGRQFSKNRLLRVMDSIGNDLRSIFEGNYLGKMDNSKDGRNLFKSEIVSYVNTLKNIGAVEDFDGGRDITVAEGATSESVVVTLSIKPVDSAEKLYMTVTVS